MNGAEKGGIPTLKQASQLSGPTPCQSLQIAQRAGPLFETGATDSHTIVPHPTSFILCLYNVYRCVVSHTRSGSMAPPSAVSEEGGNVAYSPNDAPEQGRQPQERSNYEKQ